MKLNEKSLAQYAASGAPPDREGYLHKRGDFNKGFQKRWCILKGNLLFYYDKRIDKDPIGVIVLEGCTIELSDHEDGFTFIIQFPGSNMRTYILASESQEDMEAWMKVLSCASYDYMKLCVNELRSQLQDLESESGRRLMQSAMDDDSFQTSPKCQHEKRGSRAGDETIVNAHGGRRRNPFDTGDSLDSESASTPIGGHKEKMARTFSEMHEEFRQQIKDILSSWQQQQKHSLETMQRNCVSVV